MCDVDIHTLLALDTNARRLEHTSDIFECIFSPTRFITYATIAPQTEGRDIWGTSTTARSECTVGTTLERIRQRN